MVRVEVTDSSSSAPLGGAVVTLRANGSAFEAVTDRLGRAVLLDLEPARYEMVVTRFGYEIGTESGVAVTSSRTTTVSLRLTPTEFTLDPVVVTATRASETTLATLAATSVVRREAIERRAVLSHVDLVADQPGVQVLNGGLLQRRYTARGHNVGTSSQMLTLTDYRYTVLPSNGHNLAYSLSTNDADIERVEQVRGPAGALYGPGTSRGVLHIITRSPFESVGSSVSLTAGGRSLFQGEFRHAQRLSDRLAVKISGRYMRGDDWEVHDPEEAAVRAALIEEGADPNTLKLGVREFDIAVAGGDAALEWRGGGGTRVQANLGATRLDNAFDPLTFGGTPVQMKDTWTAYAQVRVTKDRFAANLFSSGVRGDSIWITSNGIRLAERSTGFVTQLQHGADLGSAVSLTYGTELAHMNSDTDGTQHIFTEDRDNLTTADGFLHASLAVSPQLDFSAAARLSYHSVLNSAVVTPNIGLVYRPEPGHALRASFARAAYTPGVGNGFSDFPVAQLGPYSLRLMERFRTLTFRDDCGGPCMRSPFGDPSQYLAPDATLLWPAIVALLQGDGVDLSELPAPTSADVSTILASLNLDTGGFDPVTPSGIEDIPPVERLIVNAFEVGYKGVFEDRLSLTADLHYTDMGPVWASSHVATPMVFFDAASLGAYLGQFMPAGEASALAAGIASIPVGVVTPEQAGDPTGLLLVEPQEGSVEYFGLDLGVTANLTYEWQATASYSWLSKDIVPDIAGTADFLFFTPKHRGAFALDYRSRDGPVDFAVRNRLVGSFPALNFLAADEAESYWVADATLGYRLRENVEAMLTVKNLFDKAYSEMPGLPVTGRLALLRLRMDF